MKGKILSSLAYGVLIAGFLTFGVVGYWLLEPFKFPTVSPDPIPITNKDKTVHYGEPVTTEVVSCTFSETPVTASVKYQNSEGRFYLFAAHDSVGKKGCIKAAQNRDPIPNSLPPGKYVIYITAVFHLNPLKQPTKIYQTEEFTLEASPSAGGGDVIRGR